MPDPSKQAPASPATWTITAPVLLGLMLLSCPVILADRFMPHQMFDLGRALNQPTPQFGRYLGLWMFFASAATACFTYGLIAAVRHGERLRRLQRAFNEVADRHWIAAVTLLAAAIPTLIRLLVLRGQPLTDDEAAYRFMAEVLAGGRLWVSSPPWELFFDHPFLINDGKRYAVYFVGWPALMAPAVWLGGPGFANCLYSALGAWAVFLALREQTSSGWAKLGSLLYLSSPMLMIAAATETSHTSCTAALAWLAWLVLRSRKHAATWSSDAGCALAFSVAFFIRPTSALAVGLPLLGWWLAGVVRRERSARWRGLVAFALPAVVGAGLFLAVNWIQNGSPFVVAYQHAATYLAEHPSPFLYDPVGPPREAWPLLLHLVALSSAALYRLSFDLFGWPCSLLFIPFCRRDGWNLLLLGSLALFFLIHAMLLPDVGIDSFAPMHFFEISLPLLLLTVAGLEQLSEKARDGADLLATAGRAPAALSLRWLPTLLTVALVWVSVSGFHPLRWIALRRITASVELPQRAVKESGIERALIFATHPFIEYCRSGGARGWVFARPLNDPHLEEDVLWVNHLSVSRDRELMRSFPDRQGWILSWEPSCAIALLRVDSTAAERVPDTEGLRSFERR